MPSEVLVFRKRLESIEETIRSIVDNGVQAAPAAVAVAPVEAADDGVVAELTERIAKLEAVPAPVSVEAVIAELTERIAKLEAMSASLSAEERKSVGLDVVTIAAAESDVEDSDAEADA